MLANDHYFGYDNVIDPYERIKTMGLIGQKNRNDALGTIKMRGDSREDRAKDLLQRADRRVKDESIPVGDTVTFRVRNMPKTLLSALDLVEMLVANASDYGLKCESILFDTVTFRHVS